jgi:hypothetical protein
MRTPAKSPFWLANENLLKGFVGINEREREREREIYDM